MKSFKQFISESINISGDFNGNLYVNSPSEPQRIGEEYVADILWNGSIYRLELVSETGIPSKRDLGEQLQSNYPGAIVQQIYPMLEKNFNIKDVKRYHPSKLEWID
jgi:hypothetical protein